MKTEYDDQPQPEQPRKKIPKRERRAKETARARSIPCGGCNHSRPDHIGLLGRERAVLVWCPVCNSKCEKEKWNARLGD